MTLLSLGNIILLKEKGGMRESIPRQFEKSRVPKEEKGVWGSQGEKGKFFFLYVLVNVTMYLAQRHISPKQEPSD